MPRLGIKTAFLILALTGGISKATLAAPFRLHIAKEPASLDPHLQNASGASYALQNLFRNFYRYHDDKGLIPDLGEACKRESPLVLVCKLKKDLKWSDGSALTAKDFLASYQRILDPKEAAPRADQLFKIKNALAIYKGEKKIESLGITAPDQRTLRFEFESKDPEFEYLLANYLLAPIKRTDKASLQKAFSASGAKELVTSGPYKLSAWVPGEKLVLESNAFYNAGKNKSRPSVEVLFIAEDSVALQLYEKDGLSFLRRLPSLFIPTYKKRPDFLWIPLIRFDYIGFGPAFKDNLPLREAFSFSLNYKELQRIYSSEGVPGCPGIPRKWLKKELCYTFDVAKAQAALKKAGTPPKNLLFVYSVLGGEDHRRTTEWLQSQWLTNLKVPIQTAARDNKLFLAELEQGPPNLFRKGASPDRPTCLAALETFAENSPENYLKIKDAAFSETLRKMGETTLASEQRKLCTDGVKFLMKNHLLIPTGPMHFAMLIKKQYRGWNINSLNQLDLGDLEEHN